MFSPQYLFHWKMYLYIYIHVHITHIWAPAKTSDILEQLHQDIDTWNYHETLRNDRGDTKNDDFWYTCLPDFITNVRNDEGHTHKKRWPFQPRPFADVVGLVRCSYIHIFFVYYVLTYIQLILLNLSSRQTPRIVRGSPVDMASLCRFRAGQRTSDLVMFLLMPYQPSTRAYCWWTKSWHRLEFSNTVVDGDI